MRIYKTREDFDNLDLTNVFPGTICTIIDEAADPTYIFQNGQWNTFLTTVVDNVGDISAVYINGEVAPVPIYLLDSSGNVTGLKAPNGAHLCADPLVDLAHAARALVAQGVDQATAPTRIFKPGSDFASSGSTNAIARVADVSVCGRESNSLKVTPSANTNAYIAYTYGGSPKDWTGATEFGLLVWSDDELPDNATISFRYGNDTTWNNYKLCTMPLGSSGTRSGMQYIKFRADQTTSLWGPFAGSPLGTGWTTGGTGATIDNNIQFVRIDFGNLSGVPVWIEGIYTGGTTRPVVVLYFDNWFDQDPGASYVKHSQYIKPILDRYGWKCGITVPIDTIGVNPSLSEMTSLHNEGHDILLNDVSDEGFITSARTDAQIAADIATTRATLGAYGFYRGNASWVLNQNESTAAHRALLAAAGIGMARAGSAERRFQHLEMGIEDPLNIGSTTMDAVTSTNAKALFDRVVAYSAIGHVYWHKFASGGTIDGARPGTTLTSWVEEFVDYMAYLRTLEVAGYIDVLSPTQYQLRSRFTGNVYQAS